MAGEFIGLTVLVKLRSPDAKIQGFVADVAGQQLSLKDVLWLSSGNRTPSFFVEGTNIADLEIVSTSQSSKGELIDKTRHLLAVEPSLQYDNYQSPFHPSDSTLRAHQDLTASPPPSERIEKSYVDPAILSYSKPPAYPNTSSSTANTHSSLIPHEEEFNNSQTSPGNIIPKVPVNTKPTISTSTISHTRPRNGSVVSATLTGPFDDLALEQTRRPEVRKAISKTDIGNKENSPIYHPRTISPRTDGKAMTKKSRRGRKPREYLQQSRETFMPISHDSQYSKMVARDQAQGAIVAVHPAELQTTSRKSRGPLKNLEKQNGWATEDATDIQEMGEFDFAGNLSKFDKSRVFDEIRNDDTTADEDRLISYNRLPLPRAGTAGGKNLHHTENVLDSPKLGGNASWNSEAGESNSSDAGGKKVSSGRSSKRAMSRATTMRKHRPHKGSATQAVNNHQTSSSGLLIDSSTTARNSSSRHTDSPNLKIDNAVPKVELSVLEPSFLIIPSNKQCSVVSPLQMLEVERSAISELGMAEDMLTENAAHGIATTVLRIIDESLDKLNKRSRMNIVILSGDNRTGARAIAAARHLHGRVGKVFPLVLGFDRDISGSVRRQQDIYEKCGGKMISLEELKYAKIQQDHELTSSAPLLIVDALLGVHLSFDDLRVDDQAAYLQIHEFARAQSRARVLSIDVPSGLDATSGEGALSAQFPKNSIRKGADSSNGRGLIFPSDYVLSLGAPKSGLLSALENGNCQASRLFVADIGVGHRAWKCLGARYSRGVDFGREWVVEVKRWNGSI